MCMQIVSLFACKIGISEMSDKVWAGDRVKCFKQLSMTP